MKKRLQRLVCGGMMVLLGGFHEALAMQRYPERVNSILAAINWTRGELRISEKIHKIVYHSHDGMQRTRWLNRAGEEIAKEAFHENERVEVISLVEPNGTRRLLQIQKLAPLPTDRF